MLNIENYLALVPRPVLDGLVAWAREARPPGGFLSAVIEDRLVESFALADEGNRAAMFYIARFCYNEMPAESRGPGALTTWPERLKQLADAGIVV